MAKGNILQDTFEQLAELGQSTAKKTVKSVAQTLNPLSSLEKNSPTGASGEKVKDKGENHTPLDFKKLQENYMSQDSKQTDVLRQRLFNLVRQGDERIMHEKKQKEMEKQRQEAMDIQAKKRKEQQKLQQQGGAMPTGKSRRSVFSHKKVVKEQQAEMKPATGKQ